MTGGIDSGKLIIQRVGRFIAAMVTGPLGHAVEFAVFDPDNMSVVGNIYMARPENTIRSIGAAFLEYLPGKKGYFRFSEAQEGVKIQNRMMVQAVRDKIKAKEPLLSSNISIPGRYSVILPEKSCLLFSEKLNDREAEKAFEDIYSPGIFDGAGFILRTRSVNADTDTVVREMHSLCRLWRNILDNAEKTAAPGLVYKAPPPYIAIMRDLSDINIKQILTDDEEIYEEIKGYTTAWQTPDVPLPELYEGSISFETVYGLRKELEDALREKVWLRCGGYLVIEHTEALVSIDVNTGKYISGKCSEEEHLKVNIEAASEAVKQIRLRNLSGTIIIDFINMKQERYNEMLLDYLRDLLRSDPLKAKLIDMTGLGLVEIARKKVKKPLYEIIDISLLQ